MLIYDIIKKTYIFIDSERAIFGIQTAQIPPNHILHQYSQWFLELYLTVMKFPFYILFKLFNTWFNQFVSLPTNFFFSNLAYTVRRSLMLWSNLSYRKLLPTFILLFISQKWFYFFSFILRHAPIPRSCWMSWYRH